MQRVPCFQCMRDTVIAPDGYHCSHCGADLQHLLLPETVAEYFQARANDSSERGELGAALAEAERGLTYADSSELHLLAAILSKQLGRHDKMRQHVAAIPVDDSLRGEAEWLLRSHQDRERAHGAGRPAATPRWRGQRVSSRFPGAPARGHSGASGQDSGNEMWAGGPRRDSEPACTVGCAHVGAVSTQRCGRGRRACGRARVAETASPDICASEYFHTPGPPETACASSRTNTSGFVPLAKAKIAPSMSCDFASS